MVLYRIQMDNGLYFLYEYPWSATSWDAKCVREVLGREGVKRVRGDMCQFVMFQEVDGTPQLVMNPTAFMANVDEVAKELNRICSRDHGEEMHEVHKHNVYTKVPIEDCWDRTGKSPVEVRWLDINKGDSVHPEYKSRLVAKDFNNH